jgi:hypothetical protein
MNYTNVLRIFYVEWKAIQKLSKEEAPDVPMLSKNLTPVRWMESIKDYLSHVFGVRDCQTIAVA